MSSQNKQFKTPSPSLSCLFREPSQITLAFRVGQVVRKMLTSLQLKCKQGYIYGQKVPKNANIICESSLNRVQCSIEIQNHQMPCCTAQIFYSHSSTELGLVHTCALFSQKCGAIDRLNRMISTLENKHDQLFY